MLFFREFYYMQMEKYAKQAIAEGIRNKDEIIVTIESEIYKQLNQHYNRNNIIQVKFNKKKFFLFELLLASASPPICYSRNAKRIFFSIISWKRFRAVMEKSYL